MTEDFHIVTAAHGISGAATYVSMLHQLLMTAGQTVQVWQDTPPGNGSKYQVINAFARQFPRGGTLILVGSYLRLEPWIAHTRPRRLVFICNTSEPAQTFKTLAVLRQANLPEPEIVYVSTRLRDTIGLSGEVFTELLDCTTFQPALVRAERPFTVGRLSRDHPDKHHAEDFSLYRLLTWHGANVRIMGGSCLRAALGEAPGVELLPAGAEHAADFLRSLDVFFYRTSLRLHEAAGRVVMEAMACGLPVVAHASGGYTDWIQQGENGLLFHTQEEAWACLQQLMEDAELRHRLGRAARASASAIADASGATASAYVRWLLSGN